MRIFISRQLTSKSILKAELEHLGIEIHAQDLIDFEAIEFPLPATEEWLFFYSKKGVQYTFRQIDSAYLSRFKLATIGKSTAQYIKEVYQLSVDFIGNGIPETTAQQFVKLAKGKVVAFMRALHSKKSIQQILIKEIIVKDYIVYLNKIKTSIELPFSDIAILTSPMNAEAFFQHIPPIQMPSYFVSIGNTTAKKLCALGVTNFMIADEPSEKGLVRAVKKLKQLW